MCFEIFGDLEIFGDADFYALLKAGRDAPQSCRIVPLLE